MQRWRRVSQMISELGSQLQQTRTVKASTTKLPVVLRQDVEGLGGAGKVVRVNHGYARNYLIPKRLGDAERKKAAGGAAAAGSRAAQESRLDREVRQRKEAAQQRRQVELLIKKLTGSPLTLKRRTQPGTQLLEQELTAKDIADAVARQLRIEVVPELLGMDPGDSLKAVGDYRLPLKLLLPGGERASLDINVLST